jgi:hypothetical protein
LRACYNYSLLQVLDHEGKSTSSVCHRVCTVEDKKGIIFYNIFRSTVIDWLDFLDNHVNSFYIHVSWIYEVISLIIFIVDGCTSNRWWCDKKVIIAIKVCLIFKTKIWIIL